MTNVGVESDNKDDQQTVEGEDENGQDGAEGGSSLDGDAISRFLDMFLGILFDFVAYFAIALTTRLIWIYQEFSRRGRKKARKSSASRAGSSRAAK